MAGLGSSRFKGEAALILAALLWGLSWVAQRYGALEIGPFSFVSARCLLATIALGVVVAIRRKRGTAQHTFLFQRDQPGFWRNMAFIFFSSVGYVMGIYCQQVAILYLNVGTTAFITAAYVVFLPFAEWAFLHRRVSWNVWLAVLLAMVGLYFLSVSQGLQIDVYSLIALGGALCWVLQVMTVYGVVDKVDGVEITFGLFLFSFILGTAGMLAFEGVDWAGMVRAAIPLLYCGFIGGALSFGLQIFGQRFTPPSLAGIFLSLEGLFAPISAWIILGELLSTRELVGGLILFIGVVVAQLPAGAGKGTGQDLAGK